LDEKELTNKNTMTTEKKMFSRSLLRSRKFWKLPSDKERLFFVLLLLDLDNIGRGLGNPYYLKGKLYEKDNRTTPKDIEKYLTACVRELLLVKYEIDGNWYIQDPVHLKHNKIVGNMTDKSLYPEPPQEVMEMYKQSITKYYEIELNSSEGKGKGKGKGKGEGKEKYQDFVLLTPLEFTKLKEFLGERAAEEYITKLNIYIGSKGARYKSHYYTILSWARKDGVKSQKELPKSKCCYCGKEISKGIVCKECASKKENDEKTTP